MLGLFAAAGYRHVEGRDLGEMTQALDALEAEGWEARAAHLS
jgi:hypothetical protein